MSRQKTAKLARDALLRSDGTPIPDVSRVIEALRREGIGPEVSFEAVMTLASVMAETLQPMLAAIDTEVHHDLVDISHAIDLMKSDLAMLRLADVNRNRIPSAGRELDAVVEATEQATEAIMSAAEAIMVIEADDIDGYRDQVMEHITAIFEACSFQDITGQRIGKVVNTLGYIEDRIGSLVERLRLLEPGSDEAEETGDERRQRELMLHGPQHKGEGVSQDDIDALLFP